MWLESLAKKRPVNFAASMPAREQSKLCVLHTNGGPCDHGSLFSFFNRAGNDICSHFQVAKDGAAEQYIATEHVAYAAFASNAYAVQIETEDDGKDKRGDDALVAVGTAARDGTRRRRARRAGRRRWAAG